MKPEDLTRITKEAEFWSKQETGYRSLDEPEVKEMIRCYIAGATAENERAQDSDHELGRARQLILRMSTYVFETPQTIGLLKDVIKWLGDGLKSNHVVVDEDTET